MAQGPLCLRLRPRLHAKGKTAGMILLGRQQATGHGHPLEQAPAPPRTQGPRPRRTLAVSQLPSPELEAVRQAVTQGRGRQGDMTLLTVGFVHGHFQVCERIGLFGALEREWPWRNHACVNQAVALTDLHPCLGPRNTLDFAPLTQVAQRFLGKHLHTLYRYPREHRVEQVNLAGLQHGSVRCEGTLGIGIQCNELPGLAVVTAQLAASHYPVTHVGPQFGARRPGLVLGTRSAAVQQRDIIINKACHAPGVIRCKASIPTDRQQRLRGHDQADGGGLRVYLQLALRIKAGQVDAA
ncbi:hypothetical protein D3C81_822630 [compost metagenome]